jgi:hypothetical protein
MPTILPEDSVTVLRLIKIAPGTTGRLLMYETGFRHDRTIDAIKALVLRGIVYCDLTNYPDFQKCRFWVVEPAPDL